MKIGIIQGRLSPPLEGFQECPTDWKREFKLLPELGLNHVEWIITRERYESNPLHSENLEGWSISSVCADFLVDEKFLEDVSYWHSLRKVCKLARKNMIPCITLPLLEGSNVVDRDRRTSLIQKLNTLSSEFPSLDFSIEAELSADSLLEIVDKFENVYVTYDTGNMTSFGVNHVEYLDKVGHKINNVHLKDRDLSAQSHLPGSGATDFTSIFKHLKKMNYNGLYTIQTAREIDGTEPDTIVKHVNYFREMYHAS